jgi:hypothetical protein
LKRSKETATSGRGSNETGALDPRSGARPGVGDLAHLVRKSRLLDPVARRQWLSVLPYLTPRDRARLEAILQAEDRNAGT